MNKFSIREILIFIGITCVLVAICISLTIAFVDKANDKNIKYDSAVVLDTDESIVYAYDTACGYCFSSSKVTPYEKYYTDEVYAGKFLYIKKCAYEYVQKTRTTIDSEGNSHTVIYYEWERNYHKSWERCVDKVLYADEVLIDGDEFVKFSTYIDTIYDHGFKEFKYEYYAVYFDESDYVLFANFSDAQSMEDICISQSDKSISREENIENTRTKLKNNNIVTPIVIIWLCFVIVETLIIVWFYKHESWIDR